MARRMERQLDAVADQDLAIGNGLDCDVAEALAQDRRCVRMANIDLGPEPRVVGVPMRDHRPRDGTPGIDMEIAGRAIEAAIGRNDEVHRTG